MIREERLKGRKEFIEKYSNNESILKANYKYICNNINSMKKENENVFINIFGEDFTLEEQLEIKKMYKKALNKLKGSI